MSDYEFSTQSVDGEMPPVAFDIAGDTICGECGRYQFRIELEEHQRSRIKIKKRCIGDGVTFDLLFADVSVHHAFHPMDGEAFTDETVHVACALIWSAVRRDRFPDATGGSDAEFYAGAES